MEEITALIEQRKNILFFYSPYNFVKAFGEADQLEHFVRQPILSQMDKGEFMLVEIEGHKFYFIYAYLPWDSNYFNMKTYRLDLVLYNPADGGLLQNAVKDFSRKILAEKGAYLFCNLPSEDTDLLQALSANGFKLIETRVNYYCENIAVYDQERFKARPANESDIANLRKVASDMRNNYDRFHADKVFGVEVADKFLATYIEQSIKGLADITLVPDEEHVPADSFLTAKYLKNEWPLMGVKISKMIVTAASSKTNKGWFKKLMSAMTYHLRDIGADVTFINTQVTNRAVIRSLENVGYRYGSSSHVMSINS